MADYIAINAAETDPDAPLTSSLLKRLVDNPIAISEGAAGAPRILTGAIADGAVTAAKLAAGAAGVSFAAGGVSDIGQIILAQRPGTTSNTAVSVVAGTNYAGSTLRAVNWTGGTTNNGFSVVIAATGFSGTWRALQSVSQGAISGNASAVATFFQRVA